jgi:murein DD-endopeptidase MepM/ murein hydrolase activator NlpD
MEEDYLKMKKKVISMALASFLFIVGLPTAFAAADNVREKIKQAQEKRKTILNEIAATTQEMDAQKKIMAEAQSKIDVIEKDAKPIEETLKIKEAQFRKVDEKFKKRIVLFYKKGEMNYMANLLASESFSQFLTRFERVRIIVKRDHQLVKDRMKAYMEVGEVYQKWLKKRKEQQQIVDEAKKAFQSLNKTNSNKQMKLNEYNEMMELHEEEVIDLNLEEWKSGKLRFPYTGPLDKPVKGSITSEFGLRYHPVFGTKKAHTGVDFGAKYGTPVYAAASGVVISSKPSSGYGWLITLYHGDLHGKHVFTRYAHSYPQQVKVRVGQQVVASEWITSVGDNGWTTGPHLHLEVRIGNTPEAPAVNPMEYMKK